MDGVQLTALHGANVWRGLGAQMKLLHSLHGEGYSYRTPGEACAKFPLFSTYQGFFPDGISCDCLAGIPGAEEYLHRGLNLVRELKPTSQLHYDIALDNTIVAPDGAVVLIDFGDAGQGDPMEDFAVLRWEIYDHPAVWEQLLEGYGGVSAEERSLIDFFTVRRLIWAAGEEGTERLRHSLHVATSIINAGRVK
jgi:hypothetical protein